MKEYQNLFGTVVVATAEEYNEFIIKTVDPIKAFERADPDVLYEVNVEKKNPLLVESGYVVMAYPRATEKIPEYPDGYPVAKHYHRKDAKDAEEAIRKVKEQLLYEIAKGIHENPFLIKLFESIDIRVGLFF